MLPDPFWVTGPQEVIQWPLVDKIYPCQAQAITARMITRKRARGRAHPLSRSMARCHPHLVSGIGLYRVEAFRLEAKHFLGWNLFRINFSLPCTIPAGADEDFHISLLRKDSLTPSRQGAKEDAKL